MDVGMLRFDLGSVVEVEEFVTVQHLLPVLQADIDRLSSIIASEKAETIAFPCVRFMSASWGGWPLLSGVRNRWRRQCVHIGLSVNRTLVHGSELLIYEPGEQQYVRAVHKGGLLGVDRTLRMMSLWSLKHRVKLAAQAIVLFPDPLLEYRQGKGRVICMLPVIRVRY